MAIPAPFESEQLQSLRAHYETLELHDLLPLAREDIFLIGAFVQTFNFIELNLRRSIEVFCAAGLIAPKKQVHTSELVELVKNAVSKLGLAAPELSDTLGKLDEIEFRRPVRNLLAHWAARRVPGYDAIALLSMDKKDTKAALGVQTVTKDHCAYSLLMLPDLRGLFAHISTYDVWLAEKTSAWHIQVSSVGPGSK